MRSDIMQTKGILVSENTPIIDYKKLKKRNINYIILRAGYTTYGLSKNKNVDKNFNYNYKKALKNNMKISTYYESCAVSKTEAESEANYFIKIIKNKKINGPIFILIRDDHSTIIYSNKSQKSIDKNELSNIITSFCKIVKANGYEVALISYKEWFDNVIDIENYDNILLSNNFDKTNNINYNLYTDNVVYICKKCSNDNKKIVLKREGIKDKLVSLYNKVFKYIKNKIISKN
jgi:GH25 family lysozyme M1 (1,4-beta-N-acetylmuramidase)